MSKYSDLSKFSFSSGDRRRFLKAVGAAAGATLLGGLSGCEEPMEPPALTGHPSHLVKFGHTDLYVSKLCQGTAFRSHLTRKGDDPEAEKLLRHCIDIGVNFFDSAEGYGSGGSEIVLGKAVSGRRGEVVIASKASAPGSESGEALGFTKEILTQKAEGSLQRLGTDYIDLYLLHNPDALTPSHERDTPPRDKSTMQHMEEIADAMDALVRSGKIRYWGVSNHLSKQVSELIELGKRSDKAPLGGLQDYYNIVAADHRNFMLNEQFPLIRKGDLGLMAFSPLGEGRLVPGRKVEEGSPLIGVINELDAVAKELGATRPQVCVAWVISHPEVTSVLAGAEKPEHVEDNFKGTELSLPAEAMRKLNSAADTYTARVAQKKASAT